MISKHFRKLQILAVLIGVSLGGYLASCAHAPTPGEFKDAIVTCTMENSSSPAALAAVGKCLTGAVTGDYGACLNGLVAMGHYTVDTVACVTRKLATESAQRLNAGTAIGTDQATLDNANRWLRDNGIKFR